ncbi:hypothetical protein [Celerinatantimonas sp. MCCC 1A17872]|uniref:hypothetical protein n=1 Tax=Celerinatantimonas sp. MCCC 1A17872 TaxID=3177514 RepID=UPI0038BE9BD1
MDIKSLGEPCSDSKINMHENKTCVNIENSSRFTYYKIHVDCKDADPTKRKCDYIVFKNASEKDEHQLALYVELKGGGVARASSQIQQTLRDTEKDFKDYLKKCFVISTGVPKMRGELQRIKKEFKQKTNLILHVERSPASLKENILFR